jgi:hypothetical protein
VTVGRYKDQGCTGHDRLMLACGKMQQDAFMQYQQCPAPAAYHATRLQTPLAGCVGNLQWLTLEAAAHAGMSPVDGDT